MTITLIDLGLIAGFAAIIVFGVTIQEFKDEIIEFINKD